MEKIVNLSREEQVKLEEELQEYLKKEGNGYYNGEYEIWFEEDCCYVDISWGDWKHDHWWAKDYTRKFLEQKGFDVVVGTNVTEENGSDCYSALHSFELSYKE